MGKDPAFLFYPNDWLGGTMSLTRHQKGCYIDLMVAQFNSGSLSLEEIRTVLGTDFPVWNTLQKKFAQDPATGNFFNERLRLEKMKRAESSKKQSERVKKRWSKTPPDKSGNTTVLPKSESGDENEVETGIETQGGVGENPNVPSVSEVMQAFKLSGLPESEGEDFWNWVDGKIGWERINNWKSYTVSNIRRKLKEQKYQNGKTGNRFSGNKQDLSDLKKFATGILRQSESQDD